MWGAKLQMEYLQRSVMCHSESKPGPNGEGAQCQPYSHFMILNVAGRSSHGWYRWAPHVLVPPTSQRQASLNKEMLFLTDMHSHRVLRKIVAIRDRWERTTFFGKWSPQPQLSAPTPEASSLEWRVCSWKGQPPWPPAQETKPSDSLHSLISSCLCGGVCLLQGSHCTQRETEKSSSHRKIDNKWTI